MSKILSTLAPTTILANCKTAHSRLLELSERFHADGIDCVQYKCHRCGLQWDDDPLRDYRTVTCSNCYGDRIIITMVRLEFQDWGPQNGGQEEQRKRYETARQSFAMALEAIRKAEVGT